MCISLELAAALSYRESALTRKLKPCLFTFRPHSQGTGFTAPNAPCMLYNLGRTAGGQCRSCKVQKGLEVPKLAEGASSVAEGHLSGGWAGSLV